MIAGEALRGGAAKAEQRFAGPRIGVEVERDEVWALADPAAATVAGRLAAVETYPTAAEAAAAAGTRGLVLAMAEETFA